MDQSDILRALRAKAEQLDLEDGLAERACLFDLPRAMIYLDGNSLGPPPHGVVDRLTRVAGQEWGVDLITSWNKNGWMGLSRRVGAKIAAVVGAEADSVRACDSTSVNVFKVLSAALPLRRDRRVVVSERGNFPTDLYVTQQLLAGLGNGYELRLIDDAATDLDEALDESVAVVLLTQVDYRTGRKLDMKSVTQRIHDAGALAVWDLAHSAGAFSVALDADGADFAIGCGYKFLNGGPGAPAFLYVAQRHWTAMPMLAGWMGHAAPFAFTPDYQPAEGVDRFLVGTPSVLALSALETALDAYGDIDMAAVQAKSSALGDLFIEAVETLCAGQGLTLASPRDASVRGAQVSFRHAEGYAVMQALIAQGVVGDFRAPDVIRFGFAPLYLQYAMIVDAAKALSDILRTKAWDRPDFKTRAAVT